MFFTYIIYSKSLNRYYVGSTHNLEQRVIEHNNSKGSMFTKRSRDWKLVYHESFKTSSEAQKREYEIKMKKSRTYIEWLINQFR